MLRTLADAGFARVTGADFSPAMLERSRSVAPMARVVRQDAVATDFSAASFDAVVMLRFVFHLADLAPVLREAARLLRPGGTLVLDSIRWTPRGLLPPIDQRLGGRLWARSDPAVEAVASQSGFAVADARRALALPSLAYRLVPAPLVWSLGLIERRAPRALSTKTFFRLERRG
jgi:SAM-dependent methyltransferase